jgi:hypothetical protein
MSTGNLKRKHKCIKIDFNLVLLHGKLLRILKDERSDDWVGRLVGVAFETENLRSHPVSFSKTARKEL